MTSLCFAYYCSGHGYGHATRVSAFACHLLRLPESEKPVLYIVSSAPEHVFADSIELGVRYRYAEIDPVIVQPVAYRVDRQKSVEVLESFLKTKDAKLTVECEWLKSVNASCVISDAAFLGCLAAKTAGIPSILSTNFTFDSVYSYLATEFVDVSSSSDSQSDHLSPHSQTATPTNYDSFMPDIPIPLEDLIPLVEQIHSGYRCADLLLLLPGNIPIPSFATTPPLPAPTWVDTAINKFYPNVVTSLSSYDTFPLLSPLPYPKGTVFSGKTITRKTINAPLIVRSPSSSCSVYTLEGRARLLNSIGVPTYLQDPEKTKILIVSFGGQNIRKPSRPNSRNSSRRSSRILSPDLPELNVPSLCPPMDDTRPLSAPADTPFKELKNVVNVIPDSSADNVHVRKGSMPNLHMSSSLLSPESYHRPSTSLDFDALAGSFGKLATPSHLYFPGAPPVSKAFVSPNITPSLQQLPTFNTIPPTPIVTQTAYFSSVADVDGNESFTDASEAEETFLLPDPSWIAIVCGVSKEQWNALDKDGEGSELPEGFYVAPRGIYMPDLTAAADVLLGKLGYGTVSECVDACTPFVYVSRPLFIEEHGLRLLLERDGVGVELSREAYEAGDWASAVQDAYHRGAEMKAQKRRDGKVGIGMDLRQKEGRELAHKTVSWVKETWGEEVIPRISV